MDLKQKNKSGAGFTVLENIIIISIIIILSVITIPYYQMAKQQMALKRSASSFVQDVRATIEKAMSVQQYSGCSHPNYRYGYGIRLEDSNPGYYKIFADCNGDRTFDSGQDQETSRIYFESGIVIKSLSSNNIDIVFEPPDPAIFISSGEAAIIIIGSLQYPDKENTITINKAGLIDIN